MGKLKDNYRVVDESYGSLVIEPECMVDGTRLKFYNNGSPARAYFSLNSVRGLVNILQEILDDHDTEEEPVVGDCCTVIRGEHVTRKGRIIGIDKEVTHKELKVKFDNGLVDYIDISDVE